MVVGPNDEAREEEEEEEEEEEDAIIVRIIDEDLEELLAKAMMADLARGAAVDDDAVTALAKRSCSVFKAIFMVDTTIKLFLCVCGAGLLEGGFRSRGRMPIVSTSRILMSSVVRWPTFCRSCSADSDGAVKNKHEPPRWHPKGARRA
jgi:hypothetical protein